MGSQKRNLEIGKFTDAEGDEIKIYSFSGIRRMENPIFANLISDDLRRFDALHSADLYPEHSFINSANRAVDSEAKILQHYANMFDPDRTLILPDGAFASNYEISGKLQIYTERFPCPSCYDTLITLIMIEGKP